jgi:hypothetical protein
LTRHLLPMLGAKLNLGRRLTGARGATLIALGAFTLFLNTTGAMPLDPSEPATTLPAAERRERIEQVRPGLSAEQVRQLLGPPQRVARQVLYHRYFEQWVYDAPLNLRIEFECRRGQQIQVQSVQAARPVQP